MSRERFAWLEQWVVEPGDIVRAPGTESNVKEIYDKCHELAGDPDNVILNQFAEFGNHIAHYLATGAALERVFESLREHEPALMLLGPSSPQRDPPARSAPVTTSRSASAR